MLESPRLARSLKQLFLALYGMPYKIDHIMEMANRYDISVIEDAFEGFGSRFNGQMLGMFGKYRVLLLNCNKMIITSGGDTSITDNENKWHEIEGRVFASLAICQR